MKAYTGTSYSAAKRARNEFGQAQSEHAAINSGLVTYQDCIDAASSNTQRKKLKRNIRTVRGYKQPGQGRR